MLRKFKSKFQDQLYVSNTQTNSMVSFRIEIFIQIIFIIKKVLTFVELLSKNKKYQNTRNLAKDRKVFEINNKHFGHVVRIM